MASSHDLPPSHQRLLANHAAMLVEVLADAVGNGFAIDEVGLLLADIDSTVGRLSYEEAAALGFVAAHSENAVAVVMPLELIEPLATVVPFGAETVARCPRGKVPVVVVDADEHPALVLVSIAALVPG